MTAVTRPAPASRTAPAKNSSRHSLSLGLASAVTVERMHHVHVAPAHRDQRAGLMLAVFELTLLMRRELDAERSSHARPKLAGPPERKDQHGRPASLGPDRHGLTPELLELRRQAVDDLADLAEIQLRPHHAEHCTGRDVGVDRRTARQLAPYVLEEVGPSSAPWSGRLPTASPRSRGRATASAAVQPDGPRFRGRADRARHAASPGARGKQGAGHRCGEPP